MNLSVFQCWAIWSLPPVFKVKSWKFQVLRSRSLCYTETLFIWLNCVWAFSRNGIYSKLNQTQSSGNNGPSIYETKTLWKFLKFSKVNDRNKVNVIYFKELTPGHVLLQQCYRKTSTKTRAKFENRSLAFSTSFVYFVNHFQSLPWRVPVIYQ